MNYTKDQLRTKYKKLPKEIQELIFSAEIADSIRQIAQTNHLRVDQTGLLADETGLVMFGLTHPNEYIPHLSQRLKIDKDQARKIAREVNEQIFAQVREALKDLHGLKKQPAATALDAGEQRKEQYIPHTIKPQQQIIAEKEVKLNEELTDDKTISASEEQLKSVAQQMETETERYKAPPEGLPTMPQEQKQPADRNIFAEKMKKESFRTVPEIVEKVEEGEKKPEPKRQYTGTKDPYREDPVNKD